MYINDFHSLFSLTNVLTIINFFLALRNGNENEIGYTNWRAQCGG